MKIYSTQEGWGWGSTAESSFYKVGNRWISRVKKPKDMPTKDLKQHALKFWTDRPCGEVYAQGETLEQQLEAQARIRYALEPSLLPRDGKDALEIGVLMEEDHLEWARSELTRLVGLDLTDRAVEITRQRLSVWVSI